MKNIKNFYLFGERGSASDTLSEAEMQIRFFLNEIILS